MTVNLSLTVKTEVMQNAHHQSMKQVSTNVYDKTVNVVANPVWVRTHNPIANRIVDEMWFGV